MSNPAPVGLFIQLPPRGLRVLVVDADDRARAATVALLARRGCTVFIARDRAHALCKAALEQIDVVLGGAAVPEIQARFIDPKGALRLTTLARALAHSSATPATQAPVTASRASA
jgi:CheY-like chemotaxis protein